MVLHFFLETILLLTIFNLLNSVGLMHGGHTYTLLKKQGYSFCVDTLDTSKSENFGEKPSIIQFESNSDIREHILYKAILRISTQVSHGIQQWEITHGQYAYFYINSLTLQLPNSNTDVKSTLENFLDKRVSNVSNKDTLSDTPAAGDSVEDVNLEASSGKKPAAFSSRVLRSVTEHFEGQFC